MSFKHKLNPKEFEALLTLVRERFTNPKANFLYGTEVVPFFNSKHIIISWSAVDNDVAVIKCPSELGIGRTPGRFRPDIKWIYPSNEIVPCNCSWQHCRAKVAG